MPAAVYVVPGRLERRTGGSIYNRRMIEGLRTLGWTMSVIELEGTFPEPDNEAQAEAVEAFASIAAGSVVVVDGLAFSALPDLVEANRQRVTLVALIHLPIAAAFGLDAARAARYEAAEGRALAAAHRVVITGPGAQPLLTRYRISRDSLCVVEPGTDPAPLARRPLDNRLRLLTAAAVHPGKGHDVLLDALAPHRAVDWELTCAGSLTRDPGFVERVRARAAGLRLDDRVHFIGEVPQERLDECYAAADVFVLATRQETYGMAVAEALARGLPVVGTATGAIADLLGADAGLVVPPGDVEALSRALGAVMTSTSLRQRLAGGARERRASLPTWPAAAARMAAVLEGAASHG